MLAAVEEILVRALYAEEPLGDLRRQAEARSKELTAEERAMLAGVNPDGFLLTSLIVKKLRFQRLTRGDVKQQEAFDANPAAWTEMFVRYMREVPPTAHFPREEKGLFKSWRDRSPSL